MYEYILNEQEEIIYNDKYRFSGAIEFLGKDEIDEDDGGFSSREIIVRFLHFPKDVNGDIEIENNNEITARGIKYIVANFAREKGTSGDYYIFHAFKLLENSTNGEVNIIDEKIYLLVENVFKRYIPFSLIPKYQLKTQDDYERLPYPRCLYTVVADKEYESVVRVYPKSSKPLDLFSRLYKLEFEFYSAYDGVTNWKFEEFIMNRRENGAVFKEYLKDDLEIIDLQIQGETNNFTENSSYINNQPRKRSLLGFELSVNYIRIKKEHDGEIIEGLNIVKEKINNL